LAVLVRIEIGLHKFRVWRRGRARVRPLEPTL